MEPTTIAPFNSYPSVRFLRATADVCSKCEGESVISDQASEVRHAARVVGAARTFTRNERDKGSHPDVVNTSMRPGAVSGRRRDVRRSG